MAGDTKLSNVLSLPVHSRSCYDCVYGLMGPLTFCKAAGESIVDETAAAADCDDFEDRD